MMRTILLTYPDLAANTQTMHGKKIKMLDQIANKERPHRQ